MGGCVPGAALIPGGGGVVFSLYQFGTIKG